MIKLKNLFPVQSRESEIESAVQNCINHIINNNGDFDLIEQTMIVGRVKHRFQGILEERKLDLNERIKVCETALSSL